MHLTRPQKVAVFRDCSRPVSKATSSLTNTAFSIVLDKMIVTIWINAVNIGGMNDFWSFDPRTYAWNFEGGFAQTWKKPLPNATDQRFVGDGGGHHGVLGVGSADNLPGADHAGYFWNQQLAGKLWLMGGMAPT